jgi:hypothetical protein
LAKQWQFELGMEYYGGNMKESFPVNPGEIYYINYTGGERPVIIINDMDQSCIVAPLTSLAKQSKKQYEIIPDNQNGLQHRAYVSFAGFKVVNKTRFKNRLIGIVNRNDLMQITNIIQNQFSNEINSLRFNKYAEDVWTMTILLFRRSSKRAI